MEIITETGLWRITIILMVSLWIFFEILWEVHGGDKDD